MSEDEIATIRTLSAYRDKIGTVVHENAGRVVDFIGDNMLAEFSSALNAVNCAIKIQNTLGQLNTKLAENRQMHLRIGIDLSEILIDADSKQDYFSDGLTMDIKLVTGEMAHTIRKVLRNPDALEYYYRGWESLFGSTKNDIEEAQQMFEETTRLEPESSFGYALAAWAHWWSVDQGLSEDIAHSLERAIELARKAEDLEDFTGLSNLVMAQMPH
jgi:hypothetical protein